MESGFGSATTDPIFGELENGCLVAKSLLVSSEKAGFRRASLPFEFFSGYWEFMNIALHMLYHLWSSEMYWRITRHGKGQV